MKKYEYKIVEISIYLHKNPKAQQELNALGADGWELILKEPNSHTLVFKRKIE